jgi:hypothetical protein
MLIINILIKIDCCQVECAGGVVIRIEFDD